MSSLFADTHNVVAILEKSDVAEDDVTRLQALVDRKKIVTLEVVIREILQLDDAEGVVCLPNEEIFAGLAQMGYEKPSTKLTFYKAFFSRVETPLFESMLATRQLAKEGIAEEQVQADDDVAAAVQENVGENVANDGAEFSTHFQQVLDTCSALTRCVKNLEHDKAAQKLEIIKLKARLKRLERANKVKSSKLRRLRKVGASKRIESSDDMEDVFNQGRMINDLDKDEGIELAEKQAEIYHLDLDHPSKVLNVTDGVTAASQVSATSATIFAAKPRMLYAKICPIFQARFDANMRFLFKSREEIEEEDQEVLKSINETPAQKAAKRRKLNEEAQEDKDLKKRLEVVDDEDDDVFTKATPLARKVPIMDYHIVLIDNTPRFKIIKADETHQLYISFITLLKNFDREDLENL
nr:hypothetical protein [Tanacetum cinerariifolium]